MFKIQMTKTEKTSFDFEIWISKLFRLPAAGRDFDIRISDFKLKKGGEKR